VSNFEQSVTANERMLRLGRGYQTEVPMSITDQFLQYAEEAILTASYDGRESPPQMTHESA
jgi:hypothetical protein